MMMIAMTAMMIQSGAEIVAARAVPIFPLQVVGLLDHYIPARTKANVRDATPASGSVGSLGSLALLGLVFAGSCFLVHHIERHDHVGTGEMNRRFR